MSQLCSSRRLFIQHISTHHVAAHDLFVAAPTINPIVYLLHQKGH